MRKLALTLLPLTLCLACSADPALDSEAEPTNDPSAETEPSGNPYSSNSTETMAAHGPGTSSNSSSSETHSAPGDQTPEVSTSANNESIQIEPISAQDTDTMLSRIQGRWVMHEVLMNGQAFEAMKGGVAEIDESTIVVESGGQKMESTFTLDESTTPIRFESVATTGMKGMAVMKFEGEELWVATALDPNAGFPVDFTAAAGVMLIKYKKE